MLANLSLKNKLLLTILPLTLIIYLVTVLLVYQSSKASTEALAEVAVKAIVQQQAAEIAGYFEDALRAARITSDMLGHETLDGQLPDMRIADQLLESLLQVSPQVSAAWWLPAQSADTQAVFWLRSGQGAQPAPAAQRGALLGALGEGLAERERAEPPRALPGGDSMRSVIPVVLPVRQNGRLVGNLGLALDASQLQARVAQLRPLGVGLAALTANDTTLVAHPDPRRVGRHTAETEADFLGTNLQAMVDTVRNGRSLSSRFVSPALGEEIFLVAVPVSIGVTGEPWSFGVALPSAALLGGVHALALKLLLLGSLGMLLAGGLILWLGRALARPLEAIVGAFRALACGEADLTSRLPSRGRDELATLAGEFNRFLEAMAELVAEIKGTGQTLQRAAEDLQEQSQAAGIGVDAQRDEVALVAAAMQQMAATVEEVADNAERAAQATREGDRVVALGQASVASLGAAIEADAQRLQQMSLLAAQLDDASQDIGTVVSVIQDIAEQTNLLALNAAIESARAGEQGRGFAVVADEVRALARRTHSSTVEVCKSIAQIQERTRTVVGMVEKSRSTAQANVGGALEAAEALRHITGIIGQVRDMSQQIATATSQQAATSEQLSRGLTTIATSAEGVAQGTARVRRRSEDLQSMSGRLNALVSRFRL
ncbi:methyl-accepting chemotaxis protein [Pseudomonas panipatensis]|uniref:Methyl-accepting chemotaxis protein n=2 Tax=Pseudomonas panipatensis TaxID=428992 RepID=A0A1G8I2Z0_9PSED|nr:methyl-accepting chemotaxis protein [Pseudomonas panipatensis]SDI13326.1 methyl-accepting chemotaxis protein [Pseudomonas panipatensis]SMP76223.1 methyl-accepting chemotaxis protein [Pseudomonas panipatensis]